MNCFGITMSFSVESSEVMTNNVVYAFDSECFCFRLSVLLFGDKVSICFPIICAVFKTFVVLYLLPKLSASFFPTTTKFPFQDFSSISINSNPYP